MAGTIAVKGLADLNRAFKAADKELDLRLRRELIRVAKPVGADAQALALEKIPRKTDPYRSGIGNYWSEMRVGATQKFVYVVPKHKGRIHHTQKSKDAFVDLLMGRAMEPALIRNEARVAAGMEHLLDLVGARWEKA